MSISDVIVLPLITANNLLAVVNVFRLLMSHLLWYCSFLHLGVMALLETWQF
jgi:hypothetical protein